MTVIANYNIHGCNVLIADTLISLDELSTGQRITLPTIGNTNSSIDANTSIYGTFQKIVILTDYCALAFAGNVGLAQELIISLREIITNKKILIHDIESEFNKLKSNDLAIIILYHEGNEIITSKGLNCLEKNSDSLGNVIYQGSGNQAISDYIDYLKNQYLYVNPPSKGDELVNYAVSIVIDQIARLLLAEVKSELTPESIKDYFGAGYEILTFFNGKFNKIDLTYVFIHLTYNEETCNIVINEPYLLISQYIKDDILFHDRLEGKKIKFKNENYLAYKYEQIKSPPIDIEVTFKEFDFTEKINQLNFTCFIITDEFFKNNEYWKSFNIRSNTPPINIKKFNYKIENKENISFYEIKYSKILEKYLIDYVNKWY